MTAIAFSPDGKVLAASGRRGVVRLWRLDSGRIEKTLRLDDRPAEAFTAGAISTPWAPSPPRIDRWGSHLIAQDVVVLPELALSLLPHLAGTPGDRLLAVPEPTLLEGERLRAAVRAAREGRCHLVAPFLELDAKTGRRFSAAAIIDPHGQVILHVRKKGPWSEAEKDWAHEGHLGTPVADTAYGRMGVLLGGDAEAEARALAEQKADVVLYPLPWPAAARPPSRESLQDLARRHGFGIVAAGWHAPGEDGAIAWAEGGSVIIANDGRVIARPRVGDAGREDATADLPLPR